MKIFFSFVILFISSITYGQTFDYNETKIYAKAFLSNDNKIYLRWAPGNYDTWKYCNTNGYRIERYILRENGNYLSVEDRNSSLYHIPPLNSSDVLKPLDTSAWKLVLDTTNNFEMVALGAIYGEGFTTVSNFGDVGIVEAYKIDSEKETRYSFALYSADMDFDIAVKSGLAIIDDYNIDPNNTYIYKIFPNGIETDSLKPYNIGYISIDVSEQTDLSKIEQVKILPQDSATIISWKIDNQKYTAYNIERRMVGDIEYETINAMPIVPTIAENTKSDIAFYPDSLPNNTTEYEYRVIGVSSFGFEGTPSDPVIAKGEPSPLVTDLSLDSLKEIDGEIVLEWQLAQEFESKIIGFEVYRSNKMNGYFEKITPDVLPPSSRSFTDNSPLPTNYYQVILIDENNNIQNSLPLLKQLDDKTPPVPPVGLVGSCDKNGEITITWTPNPDIDIDGYEVFMANSPDEEFAQLTTKPEKDTSFTFYYDLNTLKEELYIKVRALDFRQNASEFSEALKVKVYDLIPPSSINLYSAIKIKSGIKLDWKNSTSNDVSFCEIQRKPHEDVIWRSIAKFELEHPNPEDNLRSYKDTTLDYTGDIDYRLLAYDEFKNVSSSNILTIKPGFSRIRGDITNLTSNVFNLKKIAENHITIPNHDVSHFFKKDVDFVVLQWDYTGASNVERFQVYRSYNMGPFIAIKTFNVTDYVPDEILFAYGEEVMKSRGEILGTGTGQGSGIDRGRNGEQYNTTHHIFIDEEVRKGRLVKYKVMAMYKDGTSSNMSEETFVNIWGKSRPSRNISDHIHSR